MSKDSLAHKQFKEKQRLGRTRSNIRGSAKRPRLSVHISNMHISAQIINDDEAKTIVYVTTAGNRSEEKMIDMAKWVGAEIAQKAVKAKVKQVVFDRGARKYHGRIKSLADAARAGGLEF
ncbi:MAG TPA: 50S ribosomal protein L18 [Candidatus Saccharimonadales bacterium]|nr:50S ribosomal protein L18 [Candidatus Saccharimonadales bacterium]